MAARGLDDWLDFQQRVHPRTMDFDLERIREVLARLGVDRPRVPVVTVGGTNGKGSVTAFLDAVLRAGGRRVGLYTSPHLSRYQERIRIDGREIGEEALLAVFERVEAARGAVTLTFFEYATAAALVAFADAAVDCLVLEVGLGGRLDAVNAVDPDVAVVVSIGLDHVEYLGPTVEHIGREKAGIFRAGRPAIYGSASMPASIASEAGRIGARLERLGVDFELDRDGERWTFRRGDVRLADLPPPGLAGAIQYANAATALAALAAGGWLPDAAAVAAGVESTRLAGRFERVAAPHGVEWVFDVAHNADSAGALAANLAASPPAGRTLVVVGILADKDAAAIAASVAGAAPGADWCAVTLPGERGLDAGELARRLGPALDATPALAPDVVAGCRRAAGRARAGDRVLVFGSFHTVGPAREWLRLYSAAPR